MHWPLLTLTIAGHATELIYRNISKASAMFCTGSMILTQNKLRPKY